MLLRNDSECEARARYLADRYECNVFGVDLTEEFINVGKELTKWVRLSDRVELVHGNALKLPYDPHTFDVVWTEHVQLNIAEKDLCDHVRSVGSVERNV